MTSCPSVFVKFVVYFGFIAYWEYRRNFEMLSICENHSDFRCSESFLSVESDFNQRTICFRKRATLATVTGEQKKKDSETQKRSLVEDGLKNEYRERTIPIVDSALLDRLCNKPRIIIVKDGNSGKKKVYPTNIFHSPEGQPYSPRNWEKRVYKKFMADLHEAHPEIPLLNPHELRHTRATLWVKQGINLITIAKLLGHKGLKMLQEIYEHNKADLHKKELLEKKKDSQLNIALGDITPDLLKAIIETISAETLKALLKNLARYKTQDNI